jgi:TolA-binding protein
MGKFNALKDRVAATEARCAKIEEDLGTLETRIDNLKGILQTDQDGLRSRLAEVAADYQDLRMEVASAQGKQEEIDYKLKEIGKHVTGLKGLVEDRFGTDSEALPADLPVEAEPMYQAGVDAYKSGLTRKARTIFREFLKRFPDGDKADDAQYMVGETFFAEGRFTEAVEAFKVVYDQYSSGDRHREAVLKIGLSYVRSNKCQKALKIYEFAAKQFKKTPEGEAAAKEAKNLEKVCK